MNGSDWVTLLTFLATAYTAFLLGRFASWLVDENYGTSKNMIYLFFLVIAFTEAAFFFYIMKTMQIN